ncbi:MAG: YggT family protein [Ruminococcaceae bacterium]|nr:YggT family protein [Oscillospiraceae bacterium]
MIQILYIITTAIRILLDVVMICMLLRAILSFIMVGDEEGPLMGMLYAVTEFFVAPVRAVCDRFGWFEGLPLDMSFFITAILLSVIRSFLAL